MTTAPRSLSLSLSPGPFRVLVVCTGNICRSPLAERLLADALAGSDVRVGSAGTRARPGLPVHPDAERVLRELTGSGHPTFRSRRLTPALVADSDLVLTAERAHRDVVAALDRGSWARTFTLVELARLIEAPTGGADPARARAAVARAAQRRALLPPGRPEDDDVQDPIGQSGPVFRRAGYHIRTAVAAVTAALLDLPAPVGEESRGPVSTGRRWGRWR